MQALYAGCKKNKVLMCDFCSAVPRYFHRLAYTNGVERGACLPCAKEALIKEHRHLPKLGQEWHQ